MCHKKWKILNVYLTPCDVSFRIPAAEFRSDVRHVFIDQTLKAAERKNSIFFFQCGRIIPDYIYIVPREGKEEEKGEEQVSSFYHAVFREKIVQAEQSAVVGEPLKVEKKYIQCV